MEVGIIVVGVGLLPGNIDKFVVAVRSYVVWFFAEFCIHRKPRKEKLFKENVYLDICTQLAKVL